MIISFHFKYFHELQLLFCDAQFGNVKIKISGTLYGWLVVVHLCWPAIFFVHCKEWYISACINGIFLIVSTIGFHLKVLFFKHFANLFHYVIIFIFTL